MAGTSGGAGIEVRECDRGEASSEWKESRGHTETMAGPRGKGARMSLSSELLIQGGWGGIQENGTFLRHTECVRLIMFVGIARAGRWT